MVRTNYSASKYNPELMARGIGKSLPISLKASVAISSHIRNKNLARAKAILQDAIALKRAIPLKRFNTDVGHKPGNIMAGRFMVKACTEIFNLLRSVEATAIQKGLNSSNLYLSHICAHYAARSFHQGRKRRIMNKRTHVEVILEQRAEDKKVARLPKADSVKKVAGKTESASTKENKTESSKSETKKAEQVKTESSKSETKRTESKTEEQVKSKDDSATKPKITIKKALEKEEK